MTVSFKTDILPLFTTRRGWTADASRSRRCAPAG
jgi:hypothetical protein